MIFNIYSFSNVLYFKCITNEFSNFTKGKIYVGKANNTLAKKSFGRNLWTHFKIYDDEGDSYIVTRHEVNKKYFKVVSVEDV